MRATALVSQCLLRSWQRQTTLTHNFFNPLKLLECKVCANKCSSPTVAYVLSRNLSHQWNGGIFKTRFPSVLTDQPHRNAGHSKWQNIRHVKQANDQAKSREITKFLNFIKMAVRDHGSADPKVNSKLAQIIAQVKEAKLPMASVERTLQALQNQKESKSCIIPVKGPGSCLMLVDLESSHITKAKQDLNPILKKNKGILAEESVLYLFDHKGLLYCSEVEGKPVTEDFLDNATEHAIESGANDVSFIPDHPEYGAVFEFITEPSAFLKVKNSLEGLKYKIEDAEVAYIPKKWVELEDADAEAANKLYSKLNEHPDVQKVFVNIA